MNKELLLFLGILLSVILIICLAIFVAYRKDQLASKKDDAVLQALKEARRTHPQFSFNRVKGVVEGYLSTGDKRRDAEIRAVYDKAMGVKKK